MKDEKNNDLIPEESTQPSEVTVESTLPSDVLDEAILLCQEIENDNLPDEEQTEIQDDDSIADVAPLLPARGRTSKRKKNTKRNTKSSKKDSKSRFKLYRGLLIGACSLLSIILVLSLTAIIIFNSKAKLIKRESSWKKPSQEEIDAFLDGEKESVPDDALVVNPDDIQWGNIPNPLETSDGVVNILLIGLDRRPGETFCRSDTMILCTLNKHNNTLTMTSFMRDMYVQIPGYSPNRLNVAYFLGGMELLNDALELNFGVQVDANVEVDIEGFAACVELMGGVDIELTQAEADYLNRRGNWDYDESQRWTLKAGMNHLNGKQTVAYSRIRNVGNGDFDRTKRQQTVLTALYNKAKTMSLSELNALVDKFLPYLATDMTDKEILGYTLAVFSLFDKLQIKNARIPADGTYYPAWINSMAVLVPDLEANHKILADIMKVN